MLSEVHDIPNPYNVKMEDELSVNSEQKEEKLVVPKYSVEFPLSGIQN